MDNSAIEQKARELLTRIYRREQKCRPGLYDPMQMIEPEFVAEYLEYEVVYVPTIADWEYRGGRFQTAGCLDKQRHVLTISTAFPRSVQRFTAAHEIGHIVLDHSGTTIHRDRPVSDIGRVQREPLERDADYFGASLLVPRGLLEREYKKRFPLGPPLPLDDAVAFNLCGRSSHALMRAGPNSFEFAAAVASSRTFNGQHFRSLADAFNVSVSVMAIRLRELDFLRE